MITESAINDILANPFDREWTIQGFGMLRTYLDDEQVQRLHIWDTSAAVEDVSTIHDHPWDFTSLILRGAIRNQRFALHEMGESDTGKPFTSAQIRCGVGGGLLSDPRPVRICSLGVEAYGPGDTYSMLAPELHESFPSRGAVTVIKRSFKADRDIATVCWKTGAWVSAEPRSATRAEIEHFMSILAEPSS
jgi:hypothetical protein